MPAHLALLRAVNVGGRPVVMAELRDMFEQLGYVGAKTVLQTGNVVFEADADRIIMATHVHIDRIGEHFETGIGEAGMGQRINRYDLCSASRSEYVR